MEKKQSYITWIKIAFQFMVSFIALYIYVYIEKDVDTIMNQEDDYLEEKVVK